MSTYNTLERKHAASIEAIRSCQSLHVEHSAIGDLEEGFDELPDPEEYNRDWRGLQLDATMVEQPLRFSQLNIHWQTRDPLPKFSGEYSIPPAGEILLQLPDPISADLKDHFQRDFLGQLRRIDSAYRSSLGFISCLRMTPLTSPIEVWFAAMENIGQSQYPSGYVRLDLDYHGYMEALLLTKGFHGWQFLFADLAFGSGEGTYIVEGVRRALETLPSLFPHEDFTELQRRLEARL
ncbi:hypothetical protein ACIOJD_25635 [Streptomyces sp. NPDC088116]|uniref:hypothetical protein n=1 Tax=Streptomyces sp. NPDC088116 TaxID=3365825 RepID=UPI00381D01F2